MADNDVVTVAPYCVVCRHSSAVKWRKHVFSRGHQKASQQFLLLQVNWLQALCDAVTSDSSDHYRCVFCDSALATADALAHFSSELHRKRVEKFCRQYRCDAGHQMRPQLWLRAAQLRELKVVLSTSKVDDQVEQQEKQVEDATGERVEAFLSSAASRLQEVQLRAVMPVVEVTTREQQNDLFGPQLTLRCKTVISSEGIMQNPLGRHEGKRVWGGGIVKLRKNEWIPWTIDQLVKEEQVDQLDRQQTGTEGTTYTHRMTEVVQGEGLRSVTPVSWGASVGNVHTAAVPPWMVQTEEEYKKCNYRKQAAPSPVVVTGLTSKADKKRRDIFSELQSKSEYVQDWLPNFGGVWHDGPRSRTKQAFRKATNAAKLPRDHDRAWQSKFGASQLQVQSLLQRVSPANSQEPQPPPAVQDSVPELKQEVPSLSPIESKDNESKIGNPLDAKKQLLLAQKERLRAKMAARRRQ